MSRRRSREWFRDGYLDGVPYFIFILVGQSSWELFDRSLLWVTRSLYMNRKLLKKMYFPRLILLIASVTPGLATVASNG